MSAFSRARGLAAAGVTFAVLSLLSGCFENAVAEGRLSVRAQGDHLLVANCGTAVTGRFTVAIDKSGRDYLNVFMASSDSGWNEGEVLSTALEGWKKVKRSVDPKLAPGDTLYVAYISPGGSAESSYVIPKGGLKEGKWLRFDGSDSSQPCLSQPKP